MAACKNLLCVNSFTEANQRHALAASKQIGRANDKAEGGFLSFFSFGSLCLCLINRVNESSGDALRLYRKYTH